MLERKLLSRMLSGRIVIACIGNQWRGDDGVGPFVASLVRASERVRVIDCGETPENYLGVIARMKPEKVVVVDAADFGGKPGEIKTVARSEIAGGSPSTHMPRLTLFTDFVEAQTGAETFFVAVQPERLEFGEAIRPAVESGGRALADMINQMIDDLDRPSAGDSGKAG
jgi:hydrogenase 3 maturation protease